MRRGEVLGLRWHDLDLDAGCASIVQTLVIVGGYGVEFSEPKTARGRRMVALDPSTVQALREQRERQMLERR
jgi:integrase